METISVHSLSPKQKLALVKVGGEKILIGLSQDSISYIKTVDERPALRSRMGSPASMAAPVNPQTVPATRVKTAPVKQTVVSESVKTKQPSKKKSEGLKPKSKGNVAEKILNRNAEEGSEEGVQLQLSQNRTLAKQSDVGQSSVDDIKKLIRQKLKQMPQIS